MLTFGDGIVDKKLQELLDWMFFNDGIAEATEIMANQLAPVQSDAIIERLEELKKKKEDEKKDRGYVRDE